MREIDRIVKQLQHAYNGDASYGPSVRAALDGVDARQAAARAAPAAHPICEIVLYDGLDARSHAPFAVGHRAGA